MILSDDDSSHIHLSLIANKSHYNLELSGLLSLSKGTPGATNHGQVVNTVTRFLRIELDAYRYI